MELIELLGYVSAFFIGVILGMLGGGGSILTVPVMVYLFALNPVTATAYSLFVVGISALSGVIKNFNKKLIEFKVGTVFAIPSFIAVYLTRKYFIPALPDELFAIFNFVVTRDTGLMLFFGMIMIYVAATMIRQKTVVANDAPRTKRYFYALAIQGLIVGILTGIVGAGGGFLIIPALVILAKIPMKNAIATSLFIIAVKSLIGFIGDVENIEIDWWFLLDFSLISMVGLLIGVQLTRYINGGKLKKLFGWFVFSMGIIIIFKELL